MSQPIWLGIPNAKPEPRVLKNSMFGHVVDAFDEKTITKIGEVSPYEKRMKAMKDAENAKKEKDGDGDKQENDSTNDATVQENGAGKELKSDESTSNGDTGVAGAPSQEKLTNAAAAGDNIDAKYTGPQILIKGGKVVNDDCCLAADVLLQDGHIVEVSERIEERENMEVIDASDKYILPGGIDLTTSFGTAPFKGLIQSVDDFHTGTKAALLGGTTLIVHNLEPDTDESYTEAYEHLLTELGVRAEGEVNGENEGRSNRENGGGVEGRKGGVADVYCDFVVKVGLTWWSGEASKQLQELVEKRGITTCYIPHDIHYSDAVLVDMFKVLKTLGLLLCVQPADPYTTHLLSKDLEEQGISGPEGCYYSFSEEVELSSIHRYLSIACQLHMPLYVGTISSRSTLDLVSKKRRQGNVVFSEVALPSIALDGSKILDSDWTTAAHHVTHPPIRMLKNNGSTLLNQLASNAIQVLSSNHTAFSTAQKAYGKDSFQLIPPGTPALQERIELLWSLAVSTGVLTPSAFVACTSSLPAKLLNAYPRKGRIAVGSDADVVIFDATKDHEYDQGNRVSKVDFNVYAGMRVRGSVTSVFKDGRRVVKDGVLEDTAHTGSLITGTASPDVAFSRISILDQLTNGVTAITRDPYDGPISGASQANPKPPHAAGQRSEQFCRPPTRSGGKNMQDTTLSISVDGTFADDPIKCQKLGGYRVNQPPGGRTTQFW